MFPWISLPVLDFYNTCILPIFLYGAETWSVTVILSRTIFVTNDEICSRTGQPFLSGTVRSRHLSFIGHLYRADPGQDHHRALQACISGPPDNWRRRIGRPRQSWLRTMEADLQPMNLGLATAKRRAQDWLAWRKLVATATSSQTRSWRSWISLFCMWISTFKRWISWISIISHSRKLDFVHFNF